MARKIISQRRGKGGPSYHSPSHKFSGKISYPGRRPTYGQVTDIINSTGHSAPLMLVTLKDMSTCLLPAPVGIRVGQRIKLCSKEASIGNVVKMGNIPIGTFVCNIESKPGDGGKLLRACGSSAQIMSKEGNKVILKFPSKKIKKVNSECLATVGVVSGMGRKTKPMLKAGNAYHFRKARNKLFPRVSGVAMNVCDHPHGGTHRRNLGRSTSIKRGASPGRKVGSISPKRVGRKKK